MSAELVALSPRPRGSLRLLLVNLRTPPFPVDAAPLALVSLGGYLKAVFGSRVAIEYVDLQRDSVRSMLRAAQVDPPDVLGVSAQFGSHTELVSLLSDLQRTGLHGRCDVVVGNVIATYGYQSLLDQFPWMVACIGRGEAALAEIVRRRLGGRSVHEPPPPGCASKLSGSLVQTRAVASVPAHLARVDWATLAKSYDLGSYDEVWVEASRGCPHKRNNIGCTYCAILPDAGSQDWYRLPTSPVLEQITWLAQSGVRHIRFADEEFMADRPDEAIAFAEELEQTVGNLAASGIAAPSFDLAMRVDDVTRRPKRSGFSSSTPSLEEVASYSRNGLRLDALTKLRRIGLRQVYLGVESGSESQLRRYRKGVLPEDNAIALHVLRTLHIQAACGWIMIDPWCTVGEILENLRFIRNLRLIPRTVHDDFVTSVTSRMRALRGSPVVELLEEAGLLGAPKANMTEYAVKYEDAKVRRIVVQLDAFDRVMLSGPEYYALKNWVAREGLNGRARSTRLTEGFFCLKRLSYELISELTHASTDGRRPAPELDDLRAAHESQLRIVIDDIRHVARSAGLNLASAGAAR